MLLQLPSQHHLGTILAQGAIVSQDEVRVRVVEHRQLTQGVGHGLVHPCHLTKYTAQVRAAKLGQ